MEGSAELTVDKLELESRKAAILTAEQALVDHGAGADTEVMRRQLQTARAELRRKERAFLLKCSLAGEPSEEVYERLR